MQVINFFSIFQMFLSVTLIIVGETSPCCSLVLYPPFISLKKTGPESVFGAAWRKGAQRHAVYSATYLQPDLVGKASPSPQVDRMNGQ